MIMPAPVGVGNITGAHHAFKGRPQYSSASSEAVNGKSAYSPAHEARAAMKTAIAETPELGKAAPANLHGKVTSAIARGIGFSSLLVLQSVELSGDEIVEDVSAPVSEEDVSAAVSEEDGSAPVSDAEDGSAPASDSQGTAEEQASLDAEGSAITESGAVASTEVEVITGDPIAPLQIDDTLVDLLIESLDEGTA
jgi:hypothetical protein